ncbi:hypothetical protein SprV_0200551400 [Sparganum proliferum]
MFVPNSVIRSNGGFEAIILVPFLLPSLDACSSAFVSQCTRLSFFGSFCFLASWRGDSTLLTKLSFCHVPLHSKRRQGVSPGSVMANVLYLSEFLSVGSLISVLCSTYESSSLVIKDSWYTEPGTLAGGYCAEAPDYLAFPYLFPILELTACLTEWKEHNSTRRYLQGSQNAVPWSMLGVRLSFGSKLFSTQSDCDLTKFNRFQLHAKRWQWFECFYGNSTISFNDNANKVVDHIPKRSD